MARSGGVSVWISCVAHSFVNGLDCRDTPVLAFCRMLATLPETLMLRYDSSIRAYKFNLDNLESTIRELRCILQRRGTHMTRCMSEKYTPSRSLAASEQSAGGEQWFVFQPKYRLGHPESYLFSLSNDIFSG